LEGGKGEAFVRHAYIDGSGRGGCTMTICLYHVEAHGGIKTFKPMWCECERDISLH
jgi:hypothetical protein